MKKHWFFPLAIFLFCLNLQAQETENSVSLQGTILDGLTQKALVGSHILNLNAVLGTSTDQEGRFVIPTSVNDTLMISYVGYQTIKLRVTNDLLKGNKLSITLHQKTNEIQEVTVKTHQLIGVLEVDVKQVPKDKYTRIHINGLPQTYEVGKPKERSFTSIGAAVFQPIDFLYQRLGKKPKTLRKLKRLKEKDQLRIILEKKYDREVMLEYLQMNEEQLNALLEDCNYSAYFIKTASDLQIIEAILDCHENYKALKKGTVRQN